MVDEINLLVTELPARRVQAAHLDVPGHVHEKPAIDVRGNYGSRRTDALGEPPGD
jgi:hypothetical protein